MGGVRRIAPGERVGGQVTPGMRREQAIETEGMWAGFASVEAGVVSGWHHHGDYESAIYVLAGGLTMEFGPGGAESLSAGPGDFVLVEREAVHREINLGDVSCDAIVVRAGTGAAVINVDGPEPG